MFSDENIERQLSRQLEEKASRDKTHIMIRRYYSSFGERVVNIMSRYAQARNGLKKMVKILNVHVFSDRIEDIHGAISGWIQTHGENAFLEALDKVKKATQEYSYDIKPIEYKPPPRYSTPVNTEHVTTSCPLPKITAKPPEKKEKPRISAREDIDTPFEENQDDVISKMNSPSVQEVAPDKTGKSWPEIDRRSGKDRRQNPDRRNKLDTVFKNKRFGGERRSGIERRKNWKPKEEN